MFLIRAPAQAQLHKGPGQNASHGSRRMPLAGGENEGYDSLFIDMVVFSLTQKA